MKDLFVLVADKSMEFAVRGILSRPHSLSMRAVSFDIAVHPNRDGGVRNTGAQMLALKESVYRYGMLMMDFEGSGTSCSTAMEQEEELNRFLYATWRDRANTIVIDPELDVWAWGSDNVMARAIGWDKSCTIRDWLVEKGYRLDSRGKPGEPKKAMEDVLHTVGRARSASIYLTLAQSLSLSRCIDPAFIRLRNQLTAWFPPEHSANPSGVAQ